MKLKDILNVDVDKAKERVEKEKTEKRQANMMWEEEKSNQQVGNLIEFIEELDKEETKPNK